MQQFVVDFIHKNQRICLNCMTVSQNRLFMSIEKRTIEKAVSNPSSSQGEIDRLKRDIYRPDMEKLKLFTQMLRTNALLKKAKITHK
jgi:hypothetical protein